MRRKLEILALAAVVLMGASLVAAPADAGHKHKQKRHHSVHRFHGGHAPKGTQLRHGRVGFEFSGPRPFVVPRHIHRRALPTYRPYFHERVYFEPHGHYHAVYYFPVRARRGTVWRKHYYCNGDIYWGGPHHHYGSGISLHLEF